MSYHSFYKDLEQLARKSFPSLKEAGNIEWQYVISPLEIQLPPSVWENARQAVAALFRLSRLPAYQQSLPDMADVRAVSAPNRSVLMAYDFHTTAEGDCYLVEVNTNASGFMMASLMQMVHRGTSLADYQPLQVLAESFGQELRLCGKSESSPLIVITDENITEQKMYPEFLMYRDWFQRLGWRSELCESADLVFNQGHLRTPQQAPIDLLYNRLTDFYLQESAHQAILEAYRLGAVGVSPHPREYWLLADKQRLVEWSQPGFLEKFNLPENDLAAIRKVLIPTFEKSHFASLDEIWSDRKNLFFKPKRSHGGKSVYRGESVSRKVFERLMQEDILIQRYQPAQKMPVTDPRSVLENWKFDVRFFVYADQIQLGAARIYQGQVTNLSSPMGEERLVTCPW